MFNPEFYPTPAEVIEIMLQGEEIENKTILEPSAGKGDIVDYLNEYAAKSVLTCEINEDLQTILKTKSTFLNADFLTVKSEQIIAKRSPIINVCCKKINLKSVK